MAIEDRRQRERVARRRLIAATARSLAEREGWNAVTTRRLSTEIEYSQPVLYKHFASMGEIVEAVSLEGFADAARDAARGTRRRRARGAGGPGRGRFQRVRRREPLALRRDVHPLHPAALRRGEHPAPLVAAFGELRQALAAVAEERDLDTLTEVLWAALHGPVTLTRDDPLRPGHDADRIRGLVEALHAWS